MSKREPLLSDVRGLQASYVRQVYEAARAKDAEVIQTLVDALYYEKRPWPQEKRGSALDAAAAAGFKPSEQ